MTETWEGKLDLVRESAGSSSHPTPVELKGSS